MDSTKVTRLSAKTNSKQTATRYQNPSTSSSGFTQSTNLNLRLLTTSEILQLQRTLGNQATMRLLGHSVDQNTAAQGTRHISIVTTPGMIQRIPCQGTQHDTSNEHRVIEIDYMQQINPNSAREYEIPQGSLQNNATGYADIADQGARELYEIKRHNEPYPEDQLARYLEMANAHCRHGGAFWQPGTYYPDERIIDFSQFEANTEIIARRDARPGFIRYEKRARGGALGIAHALGGGTYVTGMANQAQLPPLNDWQRIWTEALWDKAESPDTINPNSPAYTNTIQGITQIVQAVQNKLRGGMLDKSILENGWKRLKDYVDQHPL